jgi:hypothetical protein
MTNSTTILCDGCGLPASPQHIAERVQRLERATRFRPIHIEVLFVGPDPAARVEDDFYGPPESLKLFDSHFNSLLNGVHIRQNTESNPAESGVARLLEFQKRGYYLTFLSECALTQPDFGTTAGDKGAELQHISRLAPSLIRRIRFNYKPKHVALLGERLMPLVETLQQSEIAPLLLLDQGKPLKLPTVGDTGSQGRFRDILLTKAPSGATSAGV